MNMIRDGGNTIATESVKARNQGRCLRAFLYSRWFIVNASLMLDVIVLLRRERKSTSRVHEMARIENGIRSI